MCVSFFFLKKKNKNRGQKKKRRSRFGFVLGYIYSEKEAYFQTNYSHPVFMYSAS